MHRRHDAKLGQAVVRDLFRDERGRNDARHLSPRGEHSVRDGSHEADTGTAIHQTDSACRQRAPKLRSVLPVLRTRARPRASEDADALHVDLAHEDAHFRVSLKANTQ